jgi:hypothetical protein
VRRLAGWPLLFLAGGLVAVALYAGPNQGIAIPLAAGAVLVLGFLLFGAARSVSPGPAPKGPVAPPDVPSSFRSALRGGRSSRSEVVAMLDQLDRKGPRPYLPQTVAGEYQRVRALGRSEFRDYVRGRLESIEREIP